MLLPGTHLETLNPEEHSFNRPPLSPISPHPFPHRLLSHRCSSLSPSFPPLSLPTFLPLPLLPLLRHPLPSGEILSFNTVVSCCPLTNYILDASCRYLTYPDVSRYCIHDFVFPEMYRDTVCPIIVFFCSARPDLCVSTCLLQGAHASATVADTREANKLIRLCRQHAHVPFRVSAIPLDDLTLGRWYFDYRC